MKKKRKRKPKIRNWHAISAHFRNSAGSMKDRKKEQSKNKCRKSKLKDERE